MIYVDDLGQRFPSALEGFQQGIFTNASFNGEFLPALRDHFATDIYHFWDPLPANFIVTSAMDFVNGCLLEQMPMIRDMELSKFARSWPWYLRAKTGTATSYAYMIFPRHSNIDMSVYIQAMDDMCFVINITNDILSYVSQLLLIDRYCGAKNSSSLADSTRNFLPERETTMCTIGHTLLGNRSQRHYKIWLMKR